MSKIEDFSTIFSLAGKTAVVTGGSRGIGLHAATGLLHAGVSTLVITARSSSTCDEAVKSLKSLFPAAAVHAIPADLSVPAEITRLISELKKLTDKVHILVANAGFRTAGPIDLHTDEMFTSVFDVNLRSVFNLVREILPLLEAAGSQEDPSRVVTVGSISGLQIGPMRDGAFGYDTSKAALHHLSQSFAVALGPRGVRVNCIASGGFRTAMSESFFKEPGAEEFLNSLSPDGRMGQPEDVAGVLAFLCSRAGSHVNGAVIPLDGGVYLANVI